MTTAAGLLQRRGVSAVAALVAGAALGLAFPPFGFLPGLLGWGVLMSLFDAADPARPLYSAFWRGWLVGAVFFLISTWWVSEAFFVDAEAHAWQAPFAVGLLAAGLGLFWGVAGLLYRLAAPSGLVRVVVFAGIVGLVEWLRGHIFTGFPWDLPGESWQAGSAISQGAALVGAYGMSWITVALGAAPVLLLDERRRRQRVLAVGLAALALAGLWAWGAMRLANAEPVRPNAPWVRVVQANVEESPEQSLVRLRMVLQRHIALTAQPAAHTPDIVVWPEGAIPAAANDYLAEGAWTRDLIITAMKPGQSLLVGAYRVSGSPTAPVFYNSLLAYRLQGGDLVPTGAYDKHRLVPFGEYLPLKGLFHAIGVEKLVSVGDGFASGPTPAPIAPAGLPAVQPLICYESLFPGFTRRTGTTRPAWIVNVSDDAWFGHTYGPLQHLNLASYRAIEEGLPIVRATPTGVSAVIDAYGRTTASLGHGRYGVIDAPLPPALPPTPFAAWGEGPFWVMLLLSLIPAVFGRMTQRKPTLGGDS